MIGKSAIVLWHVEGELGKIPKHQNMQLHIAMLNVMERLFLLKSPATCSIAQVWILLMPAFLPFDLQLCLITTTIINALFGLIWSKLWMGWLGCKWLLSDMRRRMENKNTETKSFGWARRWRLYWCWFSWGNLQLT